MSSAVLIATPALSGASPLPDPTVTPKRDTEPVVLTGSDLAGWSAPANQTAKLPLMEAPESFGCLADDSTCDTHNDYAEPELDTQAAAPPRARRSDGCSATAGTRARSASCRSRSRSTRSSPATSTTPHPASPSTRARTSTRPTRSTARASASPSDDPARPVHRAPAGRRRRPRQTRSRASTPTTSSSSWPPTPARRRPPTAALPARHRGARRSRDLDRPARRGQPALRLRDEGRGRRARSPPSTRSNGYVRYERDANADIFEYSESSYESYGNARRGLVLRRRRQRRRATDARSASAARATTRRSRPTATGSATTAAG